MTFLEILVLAGILMAFATFGATLAWAEYQTRNLPRIPDHSAERSTEHDQHWKAAA